MSTQDKIERYLSYLETDPNNTLLMVSIGDLYHQSGSFQLAEQYFRRVLTVDPDHRVALGRLCNLLISLNKPQEALQGYLALVTDGEDEPQIHHNIALCHFAQYRFDAAEPIFSALADDELVGHSARFYLASIKHVQDDLSEAVRLMRQLVAESPLALFRGYLATLLFTQGDIAEATELAKAVSSDDDTNADANSVLGTYYLEQSQLEPAQSSFARIAQLFPADARGWHGLGLIDLQEGRSDSAIQHLQKACALLPTNAGMRISLAWAHYTQHSFAESESEFRLALDANRNFAESWGGLSCALFMQGKIDSADDACRTALRLDSQCFGALYARSLLLKHKGQDDRAVKTLSALLDSPVRPGGPSFTDAINAHLSKQQVSAAADEIVKNPTLH